MDLGVGFLSPQILLRPLPQGGAGQDPLLWGVEAPVGQEREQRYLAWASLGFILWYLHGSPQTQVTWGLGKSSGFPGLGFMGCELSIPHSLPLAHSSSTNL